MQEYRMRDTPNKRSPGDFFKDYLAAAASAAFGGGSGIYLLNRMSQPGVDSLDPWVLAAAGGTVIGTALALGYVPRFVGRLLNREYTTKEREKLPENVIDAEYTVSDDTTRALTTRK